MEKSRDAFRTISEVAEWLDVPTHVLRFWESRFSQIKPVKRAGGRRYYRPSDMRVIGGVKVLLHDQGMTIRGVQKLFREQGIKHVSSFSPKLFGEEDQADQQVMLEQTAEPVEVSEAPATPALAARATRDASPDPVMEPAPEIDDAETLDVGAEPEPHAEPELVPDAERESAPVFDRTDGVLPDPEEAPVPAFTDTDGQTEAPDLTPVDDAAMPAADEAVPTFSHARAPQSDDADAAEGASDTAAPEPEATDEPEPPAPTIPAVDVPDEDPADDAGPHRKGPGIAARLRVQKRAALAAHREDLAEAARRLRELHGRMS